MAQPEHVATDDLERQAIHNVNPSPMAALFVLLHSPGNGDSETRLRVAFRDLGRGAVLGERPGN